MAELLKKLVNVYGVSGNEIEVRELIRKTVKPYADEITTDGIGNLIVHKKGKGPKVMLAAHMDEVGLMVKYIEENGEIRFSPIGGVEAEELLGEKVTIYNNKRIMGVITTKELSAAKEIPSQITLDELYIDIGLGPNEVKKLIKPGAYVSFEGGKFSTLGSEEVICGKALDDRIGCYVLCELLRKVKNTPLDLYAIFTVQEEVGLYGAKTSAYAVSPEYAIAIDVTNVEEQHKSKRIGHGPTITMKDSDMVGNKYMNDCLMKLAKKLDIKLQLDVSDEGTTDALSISLSRRGVPSTSIGVPIKNMHSAVGIAHMKDIGELIRLLEAFLKKAPTVCEV